MKYETFLHCCAAVEDENFVITSSLFSTVFDS